ncbi:MAG TPA: UBP-type zinc finger domain-containing protein [Aeromicrobium sp.]|nr:UBP-type zinc finger domain-containing protein [Aeromicrobium sp.]HKY57616.1 UBP-type zinc finger domain-containing protein [Aeromicrobium sp.]
MTTSLHYTWRCVTCEEAGEGERSAALAEKHTRDTQHPTITRAVPSTINKKD